jgi:hypothetical protein
VDAAWINHRNRSGPGIPSFHGSSFSSRWLQMGLILLRLKQIVHVIFEFELYLVVHIWRDCQVPVNWYFWSNRSESFAEVPELITNLIFMVTLEKLHFPHTSESLQLLNLSRFPHCMPWQHMNKTRFQCSVQDFSCHSCPSMQYFFVKKNQHICL